MTPFGERLRRLRAERGLSLGALAAQIGVSAAYLSALEHGHRGKPNRRLVHSICQALGIIWDEAEELQRLADLSHPKVPLDTAGLSAESTLLANLLARDIAHLPPERIAALLTLLRQEDIGEAPQV